MYIASLLDVQCIRVQRGDRLGVYSQYSQSAIAYLFNATNPSSMAHSFQNFTSPVLPGQAVTFDLLVFPYAFSVAAYYYATGKQIADPVAPNPIKSNYIDPLIRA